MKRLLDWFVDLFDVKGRREARKLELERQHALAEAARTEQLMELLEVVITRNNESHRHQTEAFVELAKGIQAHGQALNTWFDTFKMYQSDGDTHTLRPADEVTEAEQREIEELKAKGYPVDGPPEDIMAWMQKAFGTSH